MTEGEAIRFLKNRIATIPKNCKDREKAIMQLTISVAEEFLRERDYFRFSTELARATNHKHPFSKL